MFLVLFYCGLIPFVVSKSINGTSAPTYATASENSDATHARLVTKKSKGTSNVDRATIDCVPRIKEDDITNIIERIELSDQVNILDFHCFNGTSQNDRLFEDMQIALVTPVGREILLVLDEKRYRYTTLTLNAERENLNVHFKNISLTNCTKKHLAGSILEQIILRNEDIRNYEVCYEKTMYKLVREHSFSTNLSTKSNGWMCCRRISTKSDSTNFKYECFEKDSFLLSSSFLNLLAVLIMCTLPCYVLKLLHMLLTRSFFKQNHPKYYELQENTMSLTSILVKIAWEGNGYICSPICRRFMMLLASCVNGYFVLSAPTSNLIVKYLWIGVYCFTVIISCWACSDIMYPFYPHAVRSAVIKSEIGNFPIPKIFRSKLSKRGWSFSIYFFMPLIPFYYIFFSIPRALILTIRLGYENNLEIFKSDPHRMKFFLVFDTVLAMAFVIIHFHTYYVLTLTLRSFLLGLFLNLTYFLPYLAAISVFTFYSYGTWKSTEAKYILLKLIIYEECQVKKPDTRHANEILPQDVKLQYVLAREIYDSIRQKLLPYNKNLIWVFLRLLWLIVLSYGVLELVRMLRIFKTTVAVKVVVTASLSILPQIFNTIGWNAGGEDRKEAWKKELKQNVKRFVKAIPYSQIVLSIPTITQTPTNDSDNSENDELLNAENDVGQNTEDERQNAENDEGQNAENDKGQNAENGERQNAENDELLNAENDEGQNAENDELLNAENDVGQNTEDDERQNAENDEGQNAENDEGQNAENDERQNAENDELLNAENDERQNAENDELLNAENGEGQNAENDELLNAENDERQNAENDELLNAENDEGLNAENDKGQNAENDKGQNAENDKGQNAENSKRLNAKKERLDIQNEIG